MLGEEVGADESSDVEDEASSVGGRKATRGIGRSGVVAESGADRTVVEAIVQCFRDTVDQCKGGGGAAFKLESGLNPCVF